MPFFFYSLYCYTIVNWLLIIMYSKMRNASVKIYLCNGSNATRFLLHFFSNVLTLNRVIIFQFCLPLARYGVIYWYRMDYQSELLNRKIFSDVNGKWLASFEAINISVGFTCEEIIGFCFAGCLIRWIFLIWISYYRESSYRNFE